MIFDFIPWEPCEDPGYGRCDGIAGVVHDTIGSWPGDKDYVRANSLAHITIGPDEGQWAQHADTGIFLPHCNGANRKAWGIEFSRQSAGQPLTAWQRSAWARIRAASPIPDVYLDPESVPDASVWVNGGNYRGWISHRSVRTDDGTVQHVDYVQPADFTIGTAAAPVPAAQPISRRRRPMNFAYFPWPQVGLEVALECDEKGVLTLTKVGASDASAQGSLVVGEGLKPSGPVDVFIRADGALVIGALYANGIVFRRVHLPDGRWSDVGNYQPVAG